jgi:ABC-type uncharacterized transport system permease subunit
MLSGIGIVCFAGSYAIALLLELTRLLFRSAIRGALMLGWAGAGLFAHTVYLYYQATSGRGLPLSSERDWYLLAAWALVAVYLYLTYFHPQTTFGPFLLPLVLALVGIAAFFADPQPCAREPASHVWGAIHGISILLAVVAILVGFAAGLMYLHQAYRLKHKMVPRRGLRLPSLEWLHRANSRAMVIAAIMLGIGLASGSILILVRAAPPAERLPWSDPLILSTLLTFLWLVVSLCFTAFYKPLRQGPKVVYLTVVSLALLVVALSVGLSLRTAHRGGKLRSCVPPSISFLPPSRSA